MPGSFYNYIRRFVDFHAKDPMSRLANAVHQDGTFPKHSDDFDEISRHMESIGHYSTLLSIFDDAWQKYMYSK
ncbi:MAG: YozE family protein [Aerococcaceae bacterium]|nr:YozE family protein [Aerococcaceae bacterium]